MSTKLYSIAFAGMDGHDVAVSFTLGDLHTLPWPAEQALVTECALLLAAPNVAKIYQNSPFDRAVLIAKGFVINGSTWDTLGMYQLIQPDAPRKDLGWLGHTWLDVDPWKLDENGDGRATTHDIVELLVYNAKDALNTMKLVNPMFAELSERGNAHMFEMQMRLADMATDMEVVGLPVDADLRRKMGHDLLDKIAQKRAFVREQLSWPDFNPMSQAHREVLYYDPKFLNLTPSAWTEKTKRPSTSYKNDTVIDNLENALVRAVVDCQEMQSRFSTIYAEAGFYGKGVKDGAFSRAIETDGRLHCKWNPCGTTGSRYSSSPNAQNLRVNDRQWLRAREGRILVAADKDQLELRIAAGLSGVKELLDEMAKPNGDPHTLAAIAVWGERFPKEGKKCKEGKRLRDMVKNVVYAALYMAGVETVYHTVREKKELDPALRAALDRGTVAKIIKGYFGKFIEFEQYHRNKYEKVQRDGYVLIPPFGRRRWFPIQPPAFTEVANADIQCAGSDVVGYQMLRIQDELKARFQDAWIIMHGHDQVAVECNAADGEAVKEVIDRQFGHFLLEGPMGFVDLTAVTHIGQDLKAVK